MGFFKEFRDFAIRGNIVDLAIAVVLGGAFGKIVTGLTNAFIMPLISLILGEKNVSDIAFYVSGQKFPVGEFLQALIDFILIAFVLFLIVKGINRIYRKEEAAPPPTPEEILLLREIRDNLKNR